MIRQSSKLKSHSHTWLIIIGLLVLLMWVISCKTIQNVKEYKDYPRNTSWKTTVNYVGRR